MELGHGSTPLGQGHPNNVRTGCRLAGALHLARCRQEQEAECFTVCCVTMGNRLDLSEPPFPHLCINQG